MEAAVLGPFAIQSSVHAVSADLLAVDIVFLAVLFIGTRCVRRGAESNVGGHLVHDSRRNQTVLDHAREQVRRRLPQQVALRRTRGFCIYQQSKRVA